MGRVMMWESSDGELMSQKEYLTYMRDRRNARLRKRNFEAYRNHALEHLVQESKEVLSFQGIQDFLNNNHNYIIRACQTFQSRIEIVKPFYIHRVANEGDTHWHGIIRYGYRRHDLNCGENVRFKIDNIEDVLNQLGIEFGGGGGYYDDISYRVAISKKWYHGAAVMDILEQAA